jgi:hypothetical protein
MTQRPEKRKNRGPLQQKILISIEVDSTRRLIVGVRRVDFQFPVDLGQNPLPHGRNHITLQISIKHKCLMRNGSRITTSWVAAPNNQLGYFNASMLVVRNVGWRVESFPRVLLTGGKS